MRISGPQQTKSTSSGGAARRASSGSAFSLPGSGSISNAAAPSAARPLADVASLLALQTVDVVTPRSTQRGRMVRRGKRLLDVLDDIKISLLGGSFDGGTIANLEAAIVEAREKTDDESLEAVLDAVELRARVELAKLQRMAGR
jgi:hypothetical protein